MELLNHLHDIASLLVNSGLFIYDTLFTQLKDWNIFDNVLFQELFEKFENVPILGNITSYTFASFVFDHTTLLTIIIFIIAYFFLP